MRVTVKAKAIINAVIDGVPTTKFVNQKFEADKSFIAGLLKTSPGCVEVLSAPEKPAAEPAGDEPAAEPAPAKKPVKKTAKKVAEKANEAADDLGLGDGAE